MNVDNDDEPPRKKAKNTDDTDENKTKSIHTDPPQFAPGSLSIVIGQR